MNKNNNHLQFEIKTDDSHEQIRVDKYIRDYLSHNNLVFSRSQIQNWINQKLITINGQPVSNKSKIGANQVIKLDIDLSNLAVQSNSQNNQKWQASIINIDYEIIYQDEDLIIINKPAGLVVHPGAGHDQDTLINDLLNHFPKLASIQRNGVIHRIDKDTSGLLCIAKNQSAHHLLSEQMNLRQIKKTYLALVNGNVISGGLIDLPIARSSHNRLKQVVHEKGKQAITEYSVEKRFKMQTLLRINLLTGRTHQIRVHLKHIGFPIVGDSVYHLRKGNFIAKGSSQKLIKTLQSFKRQALHAYQLKLIHPSTKKIVSFKAQLPNDFQHLINLLSQED